MPVYCLTRIPPTEPDGTVCVKSEYGDVHLLRPRHTGYTLSVVRNRDGSGIARILDVSVSRVRATYLKDFGLSYADANDDVRAQARAVEDQELFCREQRKAMDDQQREIAVCELCNITVEQYRLLRTTCSATWVAMCLTLLKTKNFRSDFRRSVAAQLRRWLENPDVRKTYLYPVTPKQMQRCGIKQQEHFVWPKDVS